MVDEGHDCDLAVQGPAAGPDVSTNGLSPTTSHYVFQSFNDCADWLLFQLTFVHSSQSFSDRGREKNNDLYKKKISAWVNGIDAPKTTSYCLKTLKT